MKTTIFAFIAACMLMLAVVLNVSAGSPDTSAQARPGECSQGVQYTQHYQFMPTAYSVNFFLNSMEPYHICGVYISQGPDPSNVHAEGFFIWYRLPPIH